MNNITLAHIGGELVLIGGVAFYFHRKTNTLQDDLTALKKENKELADSVEELQGAIQQLGAMVMQLQQGVPRFQPQPQPQPKPKPKREHFRQPHPQQQQQQQQPNPMQDMMQMMTGMTGMTGIGMVPGRQQDIGGHVITSPRQEAPKKKRRPKSDSEDSGDDTYDDNELDKELAGEYQQLDSERTKKCEGETCQLMD